MKIKSLIISMLAVMLVALTAFGLVPLAANAVSAATLPANHPAAAVASDSSVSASAADMQATFESIYAQVNPSVVSIDVVEQAQQSDFGFSGQFGRGQQSAPQAQRALGSGFVWGSDGYIVTNNHVISGASQITVIFADGTSVPGQVVGADPNSDLAVVKVNAPAGELHPVQIGDSTQTKVGQLAIAIGNPFGEQNTMTTGIVSALGRTLPVNENATTQGPSYTIPDVIQTDAPINPGNSGGVLLNLQGQVVGVTSAIESPNGASSGIGFAIPSQIVQRVVPVLIKNGHYDHPYLGVSGTDMTPSIAQAMGLDQNQRGARS
ncbi:MAG: trypsin-like peptidase domain-containing protein, partial [Chloroflexi bacterium]|nr:trypsin-like peptidase domain-containing protein [Chloroflexota bacterium]